MVKRLIRTLFLVSAVMLITGSIAKSQETSSPEEPRFIFDTGNPPWRGERIELPPSFAPDLGWHGVEQIRFAPGMFTAGEEDFFSYVLVFLLAADSDTSETALTRELLTYYRGLSKAVMGGKGQSVETDGFSITLEKIKDPKSGPASAKTLSAYTGILNWVEPFATQKQQTLKFEIFVWKHGNQPVVFSCVSPAAFDRESPWKILRDIRAKFEFAP